MEQGKLNWLVTGGCGFIGTALIGKLKKLAPECRVRVLDNLSVGSEGDLEKVTDFERIEPDRTDNAEFNGSKAQLVVGDIRDEKVCLYSAKGMDVIVHLAANTGVGSSVENPRQDLLSNVVGIFNMLEAARIGIVERFIFASSGAPVGETTPPIHESIAPKPVSPYGASKLAGEGYCSAYYRTFGVKTVSLRFGNVYGPGSGHKSSVVAKFIRRAMEGETCEIYGDGAQTRDFVYIDDLTDAIMKAAAAGLPNGAQKRRDTDRQNEIGAEGAWGEIFQIATNLEHTVNEVAELLKKELDKNGVKMTIQHGEPRLGDVKRNFSDTSKAKKVLNFEARINLEEGIARTVDWFLGI